MKPPPSFPPPPERPRSRQTAGVLWVLAWLSLVPAVLGFAYALAADSTENRAATPLADIAVSMGLTTGALGSTCALLFGLLAWRSGPGGGLG